MIGYDEIIFSYDRAIKQAEDLERIANSIKNDTGNKIDAVLGMLNNAWNSDNSSNYLKKVTKVQGDIIDIAKRILNVAEEIRRKAEEFRAAELSAIEIANTRDYSV